MASQAMQKGSFGGVEPDRHGGISKRTIELDGVRATQGGYESGARWPVGDQGWAFIDDYDT